MSTHESGCNHIQTYQLSSSASQTLWEFLSSKPDFLENGILGNVVPYISFTLQGLGAQNEAEVTTNNPASPPLSM